MFADRFSPVSALRDRWPQATVVPAPPLRRCHEKLRRWYVRLRNIARGSMAMHWMTRSEPQRAAAARRLLAILLAAGSAGTASTARAAFLSGETLDAAANVVAWIVLIFVPIIVIVLFWMVHVLPEKIAHKRHHPQTRRDPDAVPAVAGVRRAAVADRLAVGLHEAGRLQARLRHRQARGLLRRDGGEAARRRAARDEDLSAPARASSTAMRAGGTLPPHLEALRRLVAIELQPRGGLAERAAPRADERSA